ncbi:MAG: hypothetical protein ACYDBV_14960, partial [Nitrospiria bacterium]
MADENNVNQPVAPVSDNAPDVQVATTEMVAQPPVDSADKGELILGKFKSQEDLVKSYQELESKLTREAQAKALPSQQAPDQGYAPSEQMANTPQLDPESDVAVRSVIRQEIENRQVTEFAMRHANELADPVLRGT